MEILKYINTRIKKQEILGDKFNKLCAIAVPGNQKLL